MLDSDTKTLPLPNSDLPAAALAATISKEPPKRKKAQRKKNPPQLDTRLESLEQLMKESMGERLNSLEHVVKESLQETGRARSLIL